MLKKINSVRLKNCFITEKSGEKTASFSKSDIMEINEDTQSVVTSLEVAPQKNRTRQNRIVLVVCSIFSRRKKTTSHLWFY